MGTLLRGMRIVILDPPGFTPPYDDALASALAARGHEVHLLTAPDVNGAARGRNGYERHETFLPVSSRLLRRRPRTRLRLALKAAEYVPSVRRTVRTVRGLAPDVVHVQWLGAAPYDVHWLRRLARATPLVLTAHDLAPRRRLNAAGWDGVLRLADRVVVHSDHALARLAERGVERRRLARIPHAVFEPPPGYVATEPAGETLLFFGLVREYKGLDVLLRALPEVARTVPLVRLVVAGRPLMPVEPLRTLAERLGVADRIQWILRFVPPDEAVGFFEASAVAVLPYRELESSGVLATALGLGRPAVVTDVGSLGPIVREHGAGRVVRPEDSAALAAACTELLADPAALAAAAAGARAARDALTWESVAEQHERLYESVVAERR